MHISHVIIFAHGENVALILDTITINGKHKHSVPISFKGDKTCSAIATKRDISCIVSHEYVYGIKLDQLEYSIIHRGVEVESA